MGINVTSEIKPLKKVLLHRPGKEIENLTPEYLERLLFDDIPFLEVFNFIIFLYHFINFTKKFLNNNTIFYK